MPALWTICLFLILGQSAAFSAETAAANDPAGLFNSGMEAYKKRDFKKASTFFRSYLKGRTPDSRTTYYLALANMQSNQMSQAISLFEYIVQHFPHSKEAVHSRDALKRLGRSSISTGLKPATSREKSEKSGGSDSSSEIGRYKDKRLVHSDEAYREEYESIPKQCRVRYMRRAGDYVVPASINGESAYVSFGHDWESKIGLKELEKLKMPAPSGEPDSTKEDKARNKTYKRWKTDYEVTIGSIKRRIPFTVEEERKGVPEIGSAFLEDLKVAYGSGEFVFNKKKKEKIRDKGAAIDAYKSEYSNLPDKAEIRFSHGRSGHMLVKAYINNKSIDCMFDTGASGFFGLNHLNSVGIPLPKGKPDSSASGWAGRSIPIWRIKAKVRIGTIERTIPISVSNQWDQPPLLGQEFVRDYQYSIDRDAGRMVLTKKTVKTNDSQREVHPLYDVPCVIENDREYVTLNLNGRDIPHVLIDTGASMTIISSLAARAAGISIPAGAPTMAASGVGGNIYLRVVNVRARLGPINYNSFPVYIGGHSGSAIGQDFLRRGRFTVDRDKKLMRFFH